MLFNLYYITWLTLLPLLKKLDFKFVKRNLSLDYSKKVLIMRMLILFTRIKNVFIPNLFFALLPVSCNGSHSQEQSNSEEKSVGQKAVSEKVQRPEPFALDIEKGTMENDNYREVSWTGEHMQLVFMSIAPGKQIDLEIHNELDQFIRVEQGQAQVLLGEDKNDLNIEKNAEGDWAVLIPAGYWHVVKNTGETPLKLYVLYSPPSHPEGTVNQNYKEAQKYAEKHGH